ncbi:MAG TPA: FGGY-family carbohydrate kinase, partial [Deinococcales bacterium]|nr:FGGY-family carbohydrate kinase [Deinococcales bacterium]
VRVRPFLGGSGSPWARRTERSAWLGLSAEHGRGDLCRATLEATSAWLNLNLTWMAPLAGVAPGGPDIGPVVAAGGGARSELWLQIKSSLTGRPYVVPQVPEAAAAGAALLAGLAVGAFASPDDACRLRDVERRTVSVPPGWREAYARLRPELEEPILDRLGGPHGTAA